MSQHSFSKLTLIEPSFGTGFSFLNAWKDFDQRYPQSKPALLEFIAYEKKPLDKNQIFEALSHDPELKNYLKKLLDQYPVFIPNTFNHYFLPLIPGRVHLHCLWGERPKHLKNLSNNLFNNLFNIPIWFQSPAIPSVPTHKTSLPHIAIIGAGIAGCSLAYVLAHLGCAVTIFDPLGLAQAASGNPYGLIRPNLTVDNNYSDQFISQGAYLAINTIKDLISQGLDLEILCDRVIQEVPELRLKKRFEDLVKNNHPAVLKINSENKYQITPAALISPIKFCEALIQSAQNISKKLGNEFNFIKQRVEKLEYKNNLWNDFFNIMIITAGSEAQRLFPEENLNLKNSPGQISLIPVNPEQNPESFKIKIPLCYEGYCFPVINNQQLLGATYRAYKNPDPENNLKILDQDHLENLNYLSKIHPVLADQLRHSEIKLGRVGVRASSPDHLPLVGPFMPEKIFKQNYSRLAYGDPYAKYPKPTDWPGLFLNIGHGSKGLSTSLISAWVIASQIFNLTLPIPSNIYAAVHPARFWVRELKRGGSAG